MAWKVNGIDIVMAEGDYGVALPCEIHGAELSAEDSIKFTIKYRKNGEEKVVKEYTNIENNTINIALTKSDTDKLPVGLYLYSLDWYKNNVFMYNIILDSEFRVVDKA